MSNLNLPNLSAESLAAIVAATPHGEARLAYATTAHQVGDGAHIVVMHHASAVGFVAPERVEVTHDGHHSRTTAQRLDTILRDNGIGLRVVIRGGLLRYLTAGTLADAGPFEPTAFALDDAGDWVRLASPRRFDGRYSIIR